MKERDHRLEKELYRRQRYFESKYCEGLARMTPKIRDFVSDSGGILVLISSVSPMAIHKPTNQLTLTGPGACEWALRERGLPYIFIRIDLVGIRKVAGRSKAKNEMRKALKLPDPDDKIIIPIRGGRKGISTTKKYEEVEEDIRRIIAPLGFNGQISILLADELYYDIILLQEGQTMEQLQTWAREIQEQIYPRELFILSVALPKIVWLDAKMQC